jgi:hypothetical protein
VPPLHGGHRFPADQNQNDAIFTAGADSGVLTLTPLPRAPRPGGGAPPLAHGLLGAIVVGVDPLATPAPVAT